MSIRIGINSHVKGIILFCMSLFTQHPPPRSLVLFITSITGLESFPSCSFSSFRGWINWPEGSSPKSIHSDWDHQEMQLLFLKWDQLLGSNQIPNIITSSHLPLVKLGRMECAISYNFLFYRDLLFTLPLRYAHSSNTTTTLLVDWLLFSTWNAIHVKDADVRRRSGWKLEFTVGIKIQIKIRFVGRLREQ